MPALSGQYKTIGVSSFYIAQPPTLNDSTSPSSTPLELMVKVFYPSSMAPAPRPSTEYMTKQQAAAVAAFASVPPFLFAHLPRIRVPAVQSAPIVTGHKLPLILYSHGLGGLPETYTIQACDLASRGFVVMMPTHNDHSAAISVLPGGRTVEFVRVQGAEEKRVRSEGLVQRVHELTFLMDHLTASPTPSLPFDAPQLHSMLDHVDTSQVALIGHSFGAATAMATASFEQYNAEERGHPSRVKAVVSHDQWCLPVFDLVKDVRLSIPTLITVSQGFHEWSTNFDALRALFHSFPSSSNSRMLMIRDSQHSNFSDAGLFSAFLTKMAGALGKADHIRVWRLLDDYNALWCGQALGWKVEPPVSEELLDENHGPAEVKWLQ